MGYKSLLTLASSTQGLDMLTRASAQIARTHDAHIEALAFGVDRGQMGYSYIDVMNVVLESATEQAEAEAREISAAFAAGFAAESPDLRYALETAVAYGAAVTDLIGARARYADLVILPKPYGAGQGPQAEAALEAALFEGGAPVLVVPDTGLSAGFAKTIVLAWNRSREALTAARRALPLLKRAERVIVTVIDPPSQGPERSDPGGKLCQFLVRHGVRAEVMVLARSLPRTADVLARQCLDHDADLLVMGAYGHSRFREAILGGATRDALDSVKLPVFLAH